MKYLLPIAALTLATPAPAQTVNDDVRCLLVSSAFSRSIKEAAPRQVSAMTASFYLGRIDGRIAAPALAAAIRAQVSGLTAAKAGPVMNACAARAAAAEKRMQATAAQLRPAAAPRPVAPRR